MLLDGNMLAKGHKHLAFGAIEISPDHRLLAYSIDHDGSERFELRVRDLATGKDLPDRVPGTYYGAEWGNDNKTLFYVTIDKAHRPYRLHRHALGEASSDDVIVLEEQDERFHLWLHKTRSERFVMATLESAITTEVRFIDADKPREAARVLAARRHGVEYKPAHHGSWWYIATNDGAEDFKLVRAPVTEPSVSRWEEVIGPRDGVLLEGVEAFADHLVIREREGGQRRLVVRQMSDGQQHVVPIDEPVHAIGTTDNREHDTTMLRLAWQSMRTPRTVVDYDMKTRKATVRKVAPVRGGHDLRRYSVQRLWATSHDGAKVPISLVARRDVQPRPGQPRAHPCLLTAYAAYGYSSSPRFDRERLALLERGFVVAIAHARGGSELGRRWKNAGKLQHKRNTFLDVVAVAEKLVADGWTTPQQLALRGGSAGGLLVGATINLRPKLFRAALALVPFVDVVNTMMDSSLPLTVIEHEEWGDPNDKRFFGVIAAYSPYDNVKAQRYPDLFVTAGLNDPRVHYWEPAKWVARLRAQAQGSLILLKTKMGAGHGGASGRYESLADEALEFAFLIDRLGAPSAALPMATQAEKP